MRIRVCPSPTPTISMIVARVANPARQPQFLTMKPASGARSIVPTPSPTEEVPSASPRLRTNHLPTEELQTTTPKQAPPVPQSRP